MNRINFILLHKLFFVCITLAMFGCNNKDEPFIQELDNNMDETITILDYQVTGKRDGAISEATFNFILNNGKEIQLYLQGSYNPKPVLR